MLFVSCSYPSVVVVPQSISDDSILRIAKNHRQGRFPVAVWKHQRNKATLLRAGGIERSTIGSIMRQHKSVGGSSVASHAISSSASVEQEKYLAAVGRLVQEKQKCCVEEIVILYLLICSRNCNKCLDFLKRFLDLIESPKELELKYWPTSLTRYYVLLIVINCVLNNPLETNINSISSGSDASRQKQADCTCQLAASWSDT